MKKMYLTILATFLSLVTYGQFVAKLEVKEEIAGICDKSQVYALFSSFKGQEVAVCPVDDEEILQKLNEIPFLKDNPKYSDKGMIGLIINCNGEVVKCKMDNKTQRAELDEQIEAVFNSLGVWKAGKLNGKEVDTSKLYSFKIKKGKFLFE